MQLHTTSLSADVWFTSPVALFSEQRKNKAIKADLDKQKY